MLFVFDTNVLVSACLKPLNLPALALNHAQEIGQIVFTDVTLSELKEVISRPFIEKFLISLFNDRNFFKIKNFGKVY